MNGMILDDNMSNLTSASNEASISSSHRNEIGKQPPPAKKKRNLPGNPDPDAEVVALSPRTLMATNRFLCEICKKGFQRDQNLQLHRRGHNLPWKLKQKTNKEVKKKVYVCPEPTCVHHEAARALGDLTGIKKHFSRKHGEKKWKCEKCSKRYAVQSDWKAHSRICGTREYRCDCGTLFSRRDSFITHRAFCDALTEESARATVTPNPLLSQPGPSSTSHFNLQSQLLHNPANLLAFPLIKREHNHQQSFNPKPDLPPWLASQASPDPPWLHHSFIHHENPNPSPSPSFPSFQPTVSPHMSATALLQKAAQMGSGFSSSPLAPSAAGSGLFSREELNLASFGNKAVVTSGCMELVGATDQVGSGAPSLLHNMVSSLRPGSGFEGSISFEEALNGMLNPKMESNFQETITKPAIEANFSISNEGVGGGGGGGGSRGNDGLTRDFLGLRALSHWGFQNMSGLDQINSSPSYDRQNQN